MRTQPVRQAGSLDCLENRRSHGQRMRGEGLAEEQQAFALGTWQCSLREIPWRNARVQTGRQRKRAFVATRPNTEASRM